ncbi:titin-like [Oncorhynchus nerka]|uniref:titin-like n=1 Tax=Oncorhynchus nerka TaxID=8023 RepID=UPI0031B848C4
MCGAFSDLDQANNSSIKPSFQKKLKFQNVSEGEPAVFRCRLVAFPTPTIIWFHNNRQIHKERRRRIRTESTLHMHETSLVIDSIKDKDSGSYKVMVINTEGSAESISSLLVSMREEQEGNDLSHIRRSTRLHGSLDSLVDQKKESKFRVNLRCVGSPFDQKFKPSGRSRSKDAPVHTLYFRSSSPTRGKDKETNLNETASERALSPPSIFGGERVSRSERFNDRYSDIYCDRHTGRFSDNFSDRCSDRFSDTESLHEEVKAKLGLLQSAVKRKKRLSMSTLSSEFDLESNVSETSYADYVDQLRVKKPGDLQHVRPFERNVRNDKVSAEFYGRYDRIPTHCAESTQPRVRHSFEPQSQTRAIQMLNDDLEATGNEKYFDEGVSETHMDKMVLTQGEPQHELGFEHKIGKDLENQGAHYIGNQGEDYLGKKLSEDLKTKMKGPFVLACSETRRSLNIAEKDDFSRISSNKPLTEIFSSKTTNTQEDTVKSTEEQFEKQPSFAENRYENIESECEDKLLALRIRKWQKGMQMDQEEQFKHETDHSKARDLSYTQSEILYGEEVERKTDTKTEEKYCEEHHPSLVKVCLTRENVYGVKSGTEQNLSLSQTKEESASEKKTGEENTVSQEKMYELNLSLSPKERHVNMYGEEVDRKSATETEAFNFQHLPSSQKKSPAESSEVTWEEHHLSLKKVSLSLENIAPFQNVSLSQSKERSANEKKTEEEHHLSQENIYGLKSEPVQNLSLSPRERRASEKKTQEEQCLLSREKTHKSEMFESEEEALGHRIIKWQQDVLTEQEIAVDLDSDWVGAEYSPYIARKVEESKMSAEGITLGSTAHSEADSTRRRKPSPEKTDYEKFPTEDVPHGFRDERRSSQEKTVKEHVLTENDIPPEYRYDRSSPEKTMNEKFLTEDTPHEYRDVRRTSHPEKTTKEMLLRDARAHEGSRRPSPEKTTKERFLSEHAPHDYRDERRSSPERTAKEKSLSKDVHHDFRDESFQWPPPPQTVVDETRLQTTESEYFVSEEEALAQRILKWQDDVLTEQEEAVELESNWALAEHSQHSKKSDISGPQEGSSNEPVKERSPVKEPSLMRQHHIGQYESSSFEPVSHQNEKSRTMSLGSSHVKEHSPVKESSPMRQHQIGEHVSQEDWAMAELSQHHRRRTDVSGDDANEGPSYEPVSHHIETFHQMPFGSHSPVRGSSSVRETSPGREPSPGRERSHDRGQSPVKEPGREASLGRCCSPSRELHIGQHGSQAEVGAEGPSNCESDLRHNEKVAMGTAERKEGHREMLSKDGKQSSSKENLHQMDMPQRTKEVKTSPKTSVPIFVREISSLKVKRGEMTDFKCNFRGDPQPIVTWLKDDQPIGQNPDFDVLTKLNETTLTIYYPTIYHEGTFSCVITNTFGKSTSSATLEVTESKQLRKLPSPVSSYKVKVTTEYEMSEEDLDQMIDDELESYNSVEMDEKSLLQVPQAVLHRPRASDTSKYSCSPVEIRITAPTPVPFEMIGKDAEMSEDDGSSHPMKHKFTFCYDAAQVVSESEKIRSSEGQTGKVEIRSDLSFQSAVAIARSSEVEATMAGEWEQHILSGNSEDLRQSPLSDTGHISDPTLMQTLDKSVGSHNPKDNVSKLSRSEADMASESKQHILSRFSKDLRHSPFSHTSDITDQALMHELDNSIGSHSAEENVSNVSKPKLSVSKEAPTITGCGLQSSAALVKVSQIKQAFEAPALSEAPELLDTTSVDEVKKSTESYFPEDDIPEVVIHLDHDDKSLATNVVEGTPLQSKQDTMLVEGSDTQIPRAKLISAKSGPEVVLLGGAQISAKVKSVSPKCAPEGVQTMSHTLEEDNEICMISGETVAEADIIDTHSHLKHCVPLSSIREVQVSPKPVRPEAVKEVKTSHSTEIMGPHVIDQNMIEDSLREKVPVSVTPDDVSASVCDESVKLKRLSGSFATPEIHRLDTQSSVGNDMTDINENLSLSELSKDSAFVRVSWAHSEIVSEETAEENEEHAVAESGEPSVVSKSVSVKLKGDGCTDYLAAQGSQQQAEAKPESADLSMAASEGASGVTSLEEEVVTFSTVYDYYHPPSEWGRPLSPESEMSIECGSTFSEELTEIEQFYTPYSSNEMLQLPKTPESFHTPETETPAGYMTPNEYAFSPLERKRPSTDSSERLFSPAKFLRSPDDEGIETTPPAFRLDEGRFLSERALGLGGLQEKVQGIPPAFLKPLTKRRVFEHDSLSFYAELFGLPSPEVKWFRNKTQFVADERITMDRDGDNISLVIQNITKADQGEYICEAVNYVGEAKSVALVVVISNEVRYMLPPPSVTHQHVMEFDVEEDDDSSRSCSPQEILLEVELDENEVKEFERQVKIITIPEYTADNKSMIISLNVLPSSYEESGVDFVTQERDDLKIAFEVTEMPPRFINPICDMETPENTTVMFECSLMGIPSPIVSWFKGNKKIPHNNNKYLHSSDGDNHFLKIRNVSAHDSGIYSCRAINVVGETLCRASLLVLNPKSFIGKTRGRELTAVSLGSAKVQPQKFDLVVGNQFEGEQASEIELEFEFEQEADESQKAVRLVAMTNNEMSEQGQKYVSINFGVFAEPAKDDKIDFKGKSSELCSFRFQMTETPPKCIIPLTNVTTAVGTPVVLQCLVNGKPHPTAEWYKDGDPVKDTRYMIQEKASGHFNLIITNVTQKDAGEYKCLIQNKSGYTETTALLKVF